MRVWDAARGTDDLIKPLEGACCRWLPGPDQIAVASGAKLEILDATTGLAEESWSVEFRINALAFNSQGKRVAYRGGNGRVWISERGDSSERLVLDEGIDGSVMDSNFSRHRQCIAWSPDDSLVAAVTREKQVAVWDAETGSLIATPHRLPGRVMVLAWSPDGQTLAYGSDGSEIALWDVKNGCELQRLPAAGYVLGLHWKSDGTQLLRTGNLQIDVFDTKSGKRIRQLKGPAGGTSSVTATRDHSRIVAGSHDGGITIWDGDTGSIVASFQAHPTEAYWVQWNTDETRLASLGWDHTLRVYDSQIGLEQARDPRAIGRIANALEAGPVPSRRVQLLHEIASQHGRQSEVIPAFEAAHSRNPKNGEIPFVLADLLHGRAELHRSAGRFEEAEKDDQRAGALFKQLVEEHPDNEQYLDADTNFQIDRLERWAILRPTEMTSDGIDRLDLLPDGSVLASGPLRKNESYTITAPCPLSGVTAIRLEGLVHPSLYRGGLSRAYMFKLIDAVIEAAPDIESREFAEVPISQVTVD